MPDLFVSKEPILPKVEPKPLSSVIETPVSHIGRLKSLSSYILSPGGVTFETQGQDEKIILLLRKHIVTNTIWVAVSIILFFIPFAFPIFANFLGLTSIPVRFQFIGVILWYLFTFSFAFQNFLNWYYNVYIVTDHRVIDVDFFSLLYKHISDAPLDNIQDVTYSMGGVASVIFNYGNIYIQTAAEVREFEFEAVPSPDKVVKTIAELMEQHGLHPLVKKGNK